MSGRFAASLVEMVVAVEARQRIPDEYRQSFFGQYDLWLYTAVYDEVLCNNCWKHAQTKVFRGTDLRSTFPYLTILDDDRIGGPEPDGRGLVHPHCRCELYRVIDPRRYLYWSKKLEGEET